MAWGRILLCKVWIGACGGAGVLCTTVSLGEDYFIGLFFGRAKHESTSGLSLRSWWSLSMYASYNDSPCALYLLFILVGILDCSLSCTIIQYRSHSPLYELKLIPVRVC